MITPDLEVRSAVHDWLAMDCGCAGEVDRLDQPAEFSRRREKYATSVNNVVVCTWQGGETRRSSHR